MKRGMAAMLRRAAPGIALGAAGLALAAAAHAATVNGTFHVNVALTTDVKTGVLCDRVPGKDAANPVVVVTCIGDAPEAPAKGADARFLLHLSRAGSSIGEVEGLMPPGTVTSWHIVNGPHRDYVEIVVGW